MNRILKTLLTGLTLSALVSSTIFTVHAKKDDERPQYYGFVTEHGIECPKQGFKVELSDAFTIENRGEVTVNGEFQQNDLNSEKPLELLDIVMNSSHFFSAENSEIAIDLYSADPSLEYEKWGDAALVAQNPLDSDLEDAVEKHGYTDVQRIPLPDRPAV